MTEDDASLRDYLVSALKRICAEALDTQAAASASASASASAAEPDNELKALAAALGSEARPQLQRLSQSQHEGEQMQALPLTAALAALIDAQNTNTPNTIRSEVRNRISTLARHCFSQQYSAETFAHPTEAQLHVLKTLLYRRYPLLSIEGATSMTRSAVFYVCEGSPTEYSVPSLSWHLLTPRSSFRVVPVVDDPTNNGATATSIDCQILAGLIEEDRNNGLLPLCVFASVFTRSGSVAQNLHCDDLSRLRQLCDQHGLWLHVQGNALDLWLCNAKHTEVSPEEGNVAPLLATPPLASLALECADSLCLQPLQWFGSAAETTLLLIDQKTSATSSHNHHQQQQQQQQRRLSSAEDSAAIDVASQQPTNAAPLNAITTSELLCVCVSLSLSCNEANSQLASSYLRLCRLLVSQSARPERNFELLLSPDPNLLQHRLFFKVRTTSVSSESLDLAPETVNSLLLHRVQPHIERLHWRCETTRLGRCVVVALPHLLMHQDQQQSSMLPTNEEVEDFLSSLSSHVEGMQLAVEMKSSLAAKVKATENFEWIPASRFPNSIGLGGFRIVPAFVASKRDDEDISQPLNSLNDTLAKALYDCDAVFRGVYNEDDEMCVAILSAPERCLAPTAEAMAEATYRLIVGVHVKMELPSEVVELMSSALQMGIHEAEQRVRLDQDGQYHPISLIRALPIVGSVVSWFVAPDHTNNPRGQSFDLQTRALSERVVPGHADALEPDSAS